MIDLLNEQIREIPLSKTTSFIVDNRGKTAPTVQHGIPLIATNCINNKNLFPVYENLRYVSDETYKNWFRSHPIPGDIILTLKGSQNGAVCLVPDPVDFVIAQDMVALRVDESVIDANYLFAALRSEQVQVQIKNLDVSGVIPHLKKSDFDKLMIPYPSRNAQKYIGENYISLSNKIDLLNRQNTTLEAMAETLFRQWFVEEAHVDWEEVPLKDVVDIAIGRTPPRQEHQWFSESEIDVKWISIKDMGNDGVYIFKTSEYLTKEAVRQFNIPVIPEDTVVLSFKMTLGRVAITTQEMLSNEAIAHFKFTSKTPFIKEYLFLYLKTFKWDLLGSTSSIVTSINSAMIKDMEIAIPDIETMNKFKEVSESLFDKVKSNQQQIQTLEKLRDNLLPKLMSGEVRVSLNGEYHDAI